MPPKKAIMISILKLRNDKKDYWLNPDNWLIKDNNVLYIDMKKNIIKTIFKIKFTTSNPENSLKNLSFEILNDIDLLSCILNIHLIKDSILQYKILKSPLLKNQNYIEHIFSLGIVDDFICHSLLMKNLFLKKNETVALKILTEKEDFSFFEYFKKILKNEQFVLSLLDKKVFNNPFCLISLPNNKKISYSLLVKQGYPNSICIEKKIQFNKEVFEDIKFITKCLRRFDGARLYYNLPNSIKLNKQVSLTILKYHPSITIQNESLKTFKNFIKFSKDWFFITDDDLIQAFYSLSKKRKVTYLDDLKFFHPLINFIKQNDNPVIKDFLETIQGKTLISFPTHDSQSLTNIDNWIHHYLFDTLNKIMMYRKLSNKNIEIKPKTTLAKI